MIADFAYSSSMNTVEHIEPPLEACWKPLVEPCRWTSSPINSSRLLTSIEQVSSLEQRRSLRI